MLMIPSAYHHPLGWSPYEYIIVASSAWPWRANPAAAALGTGDLGIAMSTLLAAVLAA